MSDEYVPQDLLTMPEVLVPEMNGPLKLPSRPKTRPSKWDHAKLAALADRNNWRKWDVFFQVLEEAWASAPSKEAAGAAHEATKAAFSVFLQRFPYSAAHWRQFSLLQYKMAGIDESLACLKDAVEAYPQSVSLWVEYLTALMTVEASSMKSKEARETPQETTTDTQASNLSSEDATAVSSEQGLEKKSSLNASDTSKSEKIDSSSPSLGPTSKSNSEAKLRAEFQRASSIIGPNFNSDPFWNKYIEFETAVSQEGPSPLLLKLYLRLIQIPLYQYAQYYNQFMEISKTFLYSDVIPDSELPKYLEAFGKSSSEDLSIVEQHQLIDTYLYDIFTKTQAHVTRKWAHEASLTIQEYSPSDQKLVKAQTGNWISYLDAEIDSLSAASENASKELQYKLIVNIFERALVPDCANAELWSKYLYFIKDHCQSKEESLKSRIETYKRAIFNFLPISETKIKQEYVELLSEESGFDAANAFLFDSLRSYSGITGPRIYVKTAYVHTLTQIVGLWDKYVAVDKVISALEGLISGYFSRVDSYKREQGTKANKKDVKNGKDGENGKVEENGKDEKDGRDEEGAESKTHDLKPSYPHTVSKYLNDDGICVVAVQFLRLLERDPENTRKIRNFYGRYHVEPAFGRCVQFWRFFIEFEGYGHKNLTNLRTVVKYVKTTTALPKMAIDAFLDIYYEVTCANLAQAYALSGKENYLDILVNIHLEKSHDLCVNESARTRLANNNYLLSDTKAGSTRSKEEALMKQWAKHVAHPGVFVDAVPEMTNRIMDGPWISLLDDDLKPPPLPTFKNLEKASAPISYPDE